jgi:hypothetical protein
MDRSRFRDVGNGGIMPVAELAKLAVLREILSVQE